MDKQLIIEGSANIQEALGRIEENGVGLVFVTEKNKLIGSFSDSDGRRAFLAGANLQDHVVRYMNSSPVYAEIGTDSEALNGLFRSGISIIPLVNSDGEIKQFLSPTGSEYLPLSEPNLGKREFQLVYEALSSNWISSTGLFVEKFEEMFVEKTGLSNALSVCNGTQALFLALYTLGIKPGDEVIVPNLTFGATANAVIQVGAIPIFCDIDKETWCLDPSSMASKITARTKAVIPVHLYGYPADMNQIMAICKNFDLIVIEDCAEALGSTIAGQHVGSYGDAATFSFFANKTITTGEGGMVVFKDPKNKSKGKRIRSHGFDTGDRYTHKEWGSNFRLTNLQAGIGLGQLERFDELISHKIRIAEIYNSYFTNSSVEGLQLPPFSKLEMKNTYWLYTLLLPKDLLVSNTIEFLAQDKIESRRVFKPMHEQPAFKFENISKIENESFLNSIDVSSRGISLPTSTKLTNDQVSRVALRVLEFIKT
jgi:perosamine synthetase